MRLAGNVAQSSGASTYKLHIPGSKLWKRESSEPNMERIDIAFAGAHGTILRGWLYLPEKRQERLPAVVMIHGFSATKEMATDRFSEVFCRNGFAVLLYDHRNFGESDGDPRQLINPWAQARDVRYAISWLTSRSEIDSTRIALWGSSLGSAVAIVVGSVDSRPRAIIANVTRITQDALSPDASQRFVILRDALLDESGKGPADSSNPPQGPFAVVDEPGNKLPVYASNDPVATEWFLRYGRRPGSRWQNCVLLREMWQGTPKFNWDICLERIPPRPVLITLATGDGPIDTARAISQRHPDSIQLEVFEGHHFITYDGAAFERASTLMCDFLRRYL